MPDDVLRLTDVGLVAYLTALGFPILRMEGRPGRRVFLLPAGASEACSSYFAGATVKAREYSESMKSVRIMLATSARS